MKMQMDTEAGNKAITDGTLPKIMDQMMEQLKPEATYFTTQDGDRTAFIVFDLQDVADLPSISEPVFNHLHAKVSYAPVMTAEDLHRGLSKLA
jgi:hypothetical protein